MNIKQYYLINVSFFESVMKEILYFVAFGLCKDLTH